MGTGIVPWISRTNPIQDGEQVDALVTNRLPRQLQQRTDYLKQRLDQSDAGAALIARGVAVNSSVGIGQAVYWNSVDQEYQLALAKVEFTAMLNGYVLSPSSYCVGICTTKYSTTRADIGLFGLVGCLDVTLGAGVNGKHPDDAGAYYLSSRTPGAFVKQKPPVSVFVCVLRGDGSVHINPTPRDLLESHIHYAFDLFAEPAGHLDTPHPAAPYTFMSHDVLLPGWLPVSAFDSTIVPAGAKFGYNLAAHLELSHVWPPTPADSSYLEQDGVGVPRVRYLADINGLWWFDDCYSKGPWPIEPRPVGAGLSSEHSSSSYTVGIDGCLHQPVLEDQGYVRHDPYHARQRVYFTKMVFKTADAMVTSLRPAAGSPIQILNCAGVPALTGDLYLDLVLGSNIIENDDSGLALKGVTNLQFTRGRVVTALVPGSNVTLSGGTLVDGARNGIVTINATSDAVLSGDADLVALNGVQEQSLNNVFFLAFPQSRNTSMRLRINMPLAGVPVGATLVMYFWLLAKVSGTLPVLQNSYRVLPVGSATPVAIPSTDTGLADIPAVVVGTAGDYVERVALPISVVNGNIIFFTLQRTGEVDTYPGDVGVVRIGYRIVTE